MIGEVIERRSRVEFDSVVEETTTRVADGAAVVLFPDGTAVTVHRARVTFVATRVLALSHPNSSWAPPRPDRTEVLLEGPEMTYWTPNPRIRRHLYARVLGWLRRS